MKFNILKYYVDSESESVYKLFNGVRLNFKNNVLEGNQSSYYSNGNIKFKSRYHEGIIYEHEYFDETGNVISKVISENGVLKNYYMKPYSNKGIVNTKEMKKRGEELIEKYDIRTNRGVESTVKDMSGGNQQKLIIAREIESNPELLIAVQPTRGVDVGAIENIHDQILAERSKNKAVILMSLELEEVLKLSDRIAVMHDGELMGILDAKDANEEKVGLMMAGRRGTDV